MEHLLLNYTQSTEVTTILSTQKITHYSHHVSQPTSVVHQETIGYLTATQVCHNICTTYIKCARISGMPTNKLCKAVTVNNSRVCTSSSTGRSKSLSNYHSRNYQEATCYVFLLRCKYSHARQQAHSYHNKITIQNVIWCSTVPVTQNSQSRHSQWQPVRPW